MPKVNEEYFKTKKAAILDAAEKVCANKPIYKITMTDIMREAGLSKGAIYLSFSDVDDVILALINRLTLRVEYENRVNEILQTVTTPEEKIERLLEYMLELVNATVSSYGKIFFELSIWFSDKERSEKFHKEMHEIEMYRYVLGSAINIIDENIENGHFTPIVSRESICAFISAFIDGLIRDITLVRCYQFGEAPQQITFNEPDLPKAFTSSVLHLLKH